MRRVFLIFTALVLIALLTTGLYQKITETNIKDNSIKELVQLEANKA